MTSKFNRTLLTATLLLLVFTELVISGNSAGQAGAFLRNGLGARARGMGDTYTAIADNAFAAYYNPAGLGFLGQKEVSTSYSLMNFDRVFNYIGFSRPLPPTAGFSFGIIQTGFGDSDERASNGILTGRKIEDTQYSFLLGFSIRFGEQFAIGITPKLIYSKVADVSASSLGIDIGLMVKPTEALTLGLMVRELGQTLDYKRDAEGFGDQTTSDKLPKLLKLGAAYDLGGRAGFKNILVAYDLELSSAQPAKSHFGIEVGIIDRFRLRAGLDDGDPTTGFSVPFEVRKERFVFSYAFVKNRVDGLGIASQDFSLSYIF